VANAAHIRVGVDVVDIRRIRTIADRFSTTELESIFTATEIAQAQAARRPHVLYAVCFGAKEAVGKALGTGLAGIDWYDIRADVRPPLMSVTLTGEAARVALAHGLSRWNASYAAGPAHVTVLVVGSP
jgi:holo-[acyl-carrier protein] synthase